MFRRKNNFVDYRKVNKVLESCKYGYKHRSKAELVLCHDIYLRERAGKCRHIAHEPNVYLVEGTILFKPDFHIFDNESNDEIYEEMKGFKTSLYATKEKLWKNGYGPSKILRVWNCKKGRLVLVKTVVPKGPKWTSPSK